ncbi:hypothetical protein IW261DRAFT_1564243 [Armillaria novae-zelandiae]|uniref:Uncharacterized protein n=1 Tax=Armillaria novae-zelandiae TaxID=153914 RepID=A0AA39P8L3_9AGAR|nr:hypothetical protein IW261DRAFT_1564243 [Armillaria novae-zelandiae]
MLSKFSFSVISLLIFSSPSLAAYQGMFVQICYGSIGPNGQPRIGAQGVCINDCAAIRMGGKPRTLTKGNMADAQGEETDRVHAAWVQARLGHRVPRVMNIHSEALAKAQQVQIPAFFDAFLPEKIRMSGGQQLSQFYANKAVQSGDTFDVGFMWGQQVINNFNQQVLNPPIPFAAALMCIAQHPVNDGQEFRMILTRQLFRRFTSVLRRETSELQQVTAGHKSAVVEPIWLRTARNLTVMAYGDIKLETPVWSDLYGKDEVVRIIKSSDPDYPPKMSTKTSGGKSGGGQSAKTTGPAKSAVPKSKVTGTKPLVKSTKPAATRPIKA